MAKRSPLVDDVDQDDIDEPADELDDIVEEEGLDLEPPFDVSDFADPDSLEAFSLDGCTIKSRSGKATRPYRGQSVWLLPYTPAGLDHAFIAMASAARDGGGVDGATLDRSYGAMRRNLSVVVAGWDAVDPNTGEPYAQPYGDPEVWEEVPTELLYYIATIVRSGEVPSDRPNGSTAGRGTRGTRGSSARRTRSTATARPRRSSSGR